jgi:hypothetical protein
MFGGEIALDPCSNRYSIVGASRAYRLPKNDGLRDTWDFKSIYVNPPYGADRLRGTWIKDWLSRCAVAGAAGAEVLALIPVATNTSHWKEFVWPCAAGICFLYDTRLRFLVNGRDVGKGAPMSCAMVYWGACPASFNNIFSEFGAVICLRNSRRQKSTQETKT